MLSSVHAQMSSVARRSSGNGMAEVCANDTMPALTFSAINQLTRKLTSVQNSMILKKKQSKLAMLHGPRLGHQTISCFTAAVWSTSELLLVTSKWPFSNLVVWVDCPPRVPLSLSPSLRLAAVEEAFLRRADFLGGGWGSSPMLTLRLVYSGSNSLDRSS